MTDTSLEVTWSYCVVCEHNTKHDTEGKHLYRSVPDYEYSYGIEHSILKCRGCEAVSFRRVEYDYEAAYPNEREEWIVPEQSETFPGPNKSRLNTAHLPEIVANIFKETCQAFSAGSLTLAGIGFRATIEAICNNLEITGKELSTRITALASQGFISKKDSTRLHSIRFMGNDAAHDIKKPSVANLEAALTITEHLLTTVYILDKESAGKLEALIEDYKNFEKLLNRKLLALQPGDEVPLVKILGKDMRLISGSVKQVTNELHKRITNKDYCRLKLGKIQKFLGSSEELQHYIIEKES